NMEMEPDIENMTMNENLEYEAAKERQLWDDVQSKRSLTDYDEADVDSFHRNKRDENLKRMGQDIGQDSTWEHDEDSKEDHDVDDDRDTFDMRDFTVEDVEGIRQFFTHNVPNVIENVEQPLIPKTQHTTPPNEDYVAPATKSILDDLLEEFREEILNVTMVDEGADFNPNKDIEELEKLLANDPKPHYMEIQVNSVIINPEPFIHTQPMNPLYGIFKSYKSSSKPYKVDREMKSPFKNGLKLPFPYPVSNEHPNDVYCYFHPHFIPSEGTNTLLPSK
ncbi:hypothetical protein Tco_0836285, partial [Tanacetum coccineum]